MMGVGDRTSSGFHANSVGFEFGLCGGEWTVVIPSGFAVSRTSCLMCSVMVQVMVRGPSSFFFWYRRGAGGIIFLVVFFEFAVLWLSNA